MRRKRLSDELCGVAVEYLQSVGVVPSRGINLNIWLTSDEFDKHLQLERLRRTSTQVNGKEVRSAFRQGNLDGIPWQYIVSEIDFAPQHRGPEANGDLPVDAREIIRRLGRQLASAGVRPGLILFSFFLPQGGMTATSRRLVEVRGEEDGLLWIVSVLK